MDDGLGAFLVSDLLSRAARGAVRSPAGRFAVWIGREWYDSRHEDNAGAGRLTAFRSAVAAAIT